MIEDENKSPEGPKEDDDDDEEKDEAREGEDNLIIPIEIKHPSPEGVQVSRKNVCFVEIVPDDVEKEIADEQLRIEKQLEYFLQQKQITYCGQFKTAIMLQPTVDEDGKIDDISGIEAALHFLAIGWKVLFALVPPRRYGGGWVAFIIALMFIGMITAVVGEFATLFGCCIGMRPAVTAITFVALGTSLPDTFASRTAA